MKKTQVMLAGLALGAGVLLTGCHSMNELSPAQPVAQPQMLSQKVTITDQGLNKRVRVLGVNYAVGAGGFMKIQIEVQNTTSYQQAFNYRIDWYDENAMIISLPTVTTIPETLLPRETKMLTSTAPTDKARDFRVKFLESQR